MSPNPSPTDTADRSVRAVKPGRARVPNGWRVVIQQGEVRACCFVNSRPLCGRPFTASVKAVVQAVRTCKACDDLNDGFWAITPGGPAPAPAGEEVPGA